MNDFAFVIVGDVLFNLGEMRKTNFAYSNFFIIFVKKNKLN
jgi:hypothetical protein